MLAAAQEEDARGPLPPPPPPQAQPQRRTVPRGKDTSPDAGSPARAQLGSPLKRTKAAGASSEEGPSDTPKRRPAAASTTSGVSAPAPGAHAEAVAPSPADSAHSEQSRHARPVLTPLATSLPADMSPQQQQEPHHETRGEGARRSPPPLASPAPSVLGASPAASAYSPSLRRPSPSSSSIRRRRAAPSPPPPVDVIPDIMALHRRSKALSEHLAQTKASTERANLKVRAPLLPWAHHLCHIRAPSLRRPQGFNATTEREGHERLYQLTLLTAAQRKAAEIERSNRAGVAVATDELSRAVRLRSSAQLAASTPALLAASVAIRESLQASPIAASLLASGSSSGAAASGRHGESVPRAESADYDGRKMLPLATVLEQAAQLRQVRGHQRCRAWLALLFKDPPSRALTPSALTGCSWRESPCRHHCNSSRAATSVCS